METNKRVNTIRDRVAVLTGAVLALLGGFHVIDWDTAQTALVVAASSSLVMFIGSLVAHFQKDTQTEWPAVAMSFTAFLGSGLAALNAIGVLNLSADQIELVIGVVVAVVGLGGIPVVSSRVVPSNSIAMGPGGADDPVNGDV